MQAFVIVRRINRQVFTDHTTGQQVLVIQKTWVVEHRAHGIHINQFDPTKLPFPSVNKLVPLFTADNHPADPH